MVKVNNGFYVNTNLIAKFTIYKLVDGTEKYAITLVDGTRHVIPDKETFDKLKEASGTTTFSDVVITDKLTLGDIEDVEQELANIRELIASDVKDMVATKAELDAYDTTKLNVGDIIEVLTDETQENANTMYRFVGEGPEPFELIGKLGPYYTKDETEARFALKATEDTPEPDPSEPSSNTDLFITLTQIIDGVPTSVKLTIEQLRKRIISNDTLSSDTNIEDAEIGQFVFTEIE